MSSHGEDLVARPNVCPFCNGKAIDTLAKVFTPNTTWRCGHCQKTWTIAERSANSPPWR